MNLLNIDGTKELRVPVIIASPAKSSTSSPHLSPKDKINLCIKVFRLLRRSTVLKILLPIAFLILIFMLLSAFKSTTKDILQWIETQNLWTTFFIFMLLFTLVSFPLVVGYLVLIISCGYMFSLWRGLLVAMLGANLGVAIAHHTMKSLHQKLPIHRWVWNKTLHLIKKYSHFIFHIKKSFHILFCSFNCTKKTYTIAKTQYISHIISRQTSFKLLLHVDFELNVECVDWLKYFKNLYIIFRLLVHETHNWESWKLFLLKILFESDTNSDVAYTYLKVTHKFNCKTRFFKH